MFYLLWAGVGVSIVGSELTEFALGLWILRAREGVASAYSLLYFFLELPVVVLTPLIGFLIDRFDRRKLLLCAELTSCGLSAIVLAASTTRVLTVPMVYGYIGACSFCTAIQRDGYLAVIYKLVDARALGRANALGSLTDSIPQMLCPLAGALAFSRYGLGAVLSFDVVTFCVSASAIAALFRLSGVAFAPAATARPRIAWRSLLPDAASVRLFAADGRLRRLLAYAFYKNFFVAAFFVSLVPFLAARLGQRGAGLAMSLGGAAMVAASSLGGWKATLVERTPLRVLDLLFAGGILLFAFGDGPVSFLACMLASFAGLRLGIIKLQTTWHRAVPSELHGRAFSLRTATSRVAYLVSYALAGVALNRLLTGEVVLGGHTFVGYRVYYGALGVVALFALALTPETESATSLDGVKPGDSNPVVCSPG